jgi:hypothetical protein
VLTRLHHRTMFPTLDVRAAGACAPRGIRIPATALKGRRPRPLDDGGSDLHREHCIVAAAIPTPSGEYGAKRLDRQGRETQPIGTVVGGRPRVGDDPGQHTRSRRPARRGRPRSRRRFARPEPPERDSGCRQVAHVSRGPVRRHLRDPDDDVTSGRSTPASYDRARAASSVGRATDF